MLVFALGGKAVLPEPAPYTPPPLNPPPSTAAADVIAHGSAVYTQYCSVCHGVNGFQGRSSFPNLTVTPLLWTQEGFDQVVLMGGRADKGMGDFGKDLKPEDAVAIREFLVSRANAIKVAPPGAGPGGPGGRGGAGAPPPPRQENGHANN
jgi:quinohemoprotein ethanol dehydrogenase